MILFHHPILKAAFKDGKLKELDGVVEECDGYSVLCATYAVQIGPAIILASNHLHNKSASESINREMDELDAELYARLFIYS